MVHRGGKGKARNSPSQRSLENLSGVGKPPAKLKRTFSDPHTGSNRRPPWNHGGNRKPPQKSAPFPNQIMSHRQRTDSEKENKPVVNNKPVASSYNGMPQRVENTRTSPVITTNSVTSENSKPLYSSSVKGTVPNHVDHQAVLENSIAVLKIEDPSIVDGKVGVNQQSDGDGEDYKAEIKVVSPVLEESMTEDEEVKQLDSVSIYVEQSESVSTWIFYIEN